LCPLIGWSQFVSEVSIKSYGQVYDLVLK